MKLIKQSFEICNQTDFSIKGIKQFIEKCARVSYKSEDKMTDSSYEKFVNMLIKRDHTRPLEFGTVYLSMPWNVWKDIKNELITNEMYNDIWVKWQFDEEDIAHITTNYRYILQWINNENIESFNEDIFNQYFVETPNNFHYPRYTVHFILDRGIMDEFRTHISLSHLAESTRYCNYSKDKFNNELTFVIQDWMENVREGTFGNTLEKDNFLFPTDGGDSLHLNEKESCVLGVWNKIESRYLDGLKYGLTPQQIRSALPLSIKSELISCGFSDAWNNFFYRRNANDAHPMAREIAKPLNKEFTKNEYI